MFSPHPLNQAVIAQALHDLRNGRLCRCQSIGFTPEALEALKQPEMVSLLVNAQVPWCSVRINREVLQRLLEHGRDLHSEIRTVDRMLRLGASTEMVSDFAGLTHQEVALRREMLRLPPRKGRWPVLSESQDAALWERWRVTVKERAVALHDDSAMLDVAMDLAEANGAEEAVMQNKPCEAVTLSVVWSAIQHWIEQGMV